MWSKTSSRVACDLFVRNDGTATTPTTPPVAATARSSSSRLFRGISRRARAAVWVHATGRVDTAAASSVVWRPQWLRSMSMPSSFSRLTTAAPKSLRPALVRSVHPSPIRFRVL